MTKNLKSQIRVIYKNKNKQIKPYWCCIANVFRKVCVKYKSYIPSIVTDKLPYQKNFKTKNLKNANIENSTKKKSQKPRECIVCNVFRKECVQI